MPDLPKPRPTRWTMGAVLLAGLAVAVLGFLTGALMFGLSLALCFMIWIGGAWMLNRRRQRADRRQQRAEG